MFGADHSLVATARIWLGVLLRDQGGHLDEADRQLRAALEVYRRKLPENHDSIARCLNNLGWVLLDKGVFEEAERYLREATDIFRKQHPDGHCDDGHPRLGLARMALARGDAQGAETLASGVVSDWSRFYPADHWNRALAASIHGECLSALGRFEEASPVLQASYETMAAQRGPTDRYVREALERIEGLYAAWGKPEEAAAHRARAKESRVTNRTPVGAP